MIEAQEGVLHVFTWTWLSPLSLAMLRHVSLAWTVYVEHLF